MGFVKRRLNRGCIYISNGMYMFRCLVFSGISINKKMQGATGYYTLYHKDTGALCQYKYSVNEQYNNTKLLKIFQ